MVCWASPRIFLTVAASIFISSEHVSTRFVYSCMLAIHSVLCVVDSMFGSIQSVSDSVLDKHIARVIMFVKAFRHAFSSNHQKRC